ncbi:MAG: FIST C-terminal domain-containing protein, partial [Anaerohalosphaeraceae bacterium]
VASQKACDAQIKPKLVMVFNCASRLSTLDKDVMRELYGIKSVYGDVPIAGFYSSGEIGPVEGETLVGGRGQMISICSIYSN